MDLVSALISGVRGAENGTAAIFIRGTTTRSTYYLDFEGTSAVTSGQDVILDSSGGAEVYVNRLVDIVVYNSSGTAVRSFVAGHSAPAVEVISSSFTGTNYASGATGASLPTTLQSVLDKWSTSAGTTDFNVIATGTSAATTLSLGLATMGKVIFNVRAYGATGNGVSDDSTAITQCLVAAAAAGDGTLVYFPAGTYRINSGLTLFAGLSVLGFGATIDNRHATAAAITVADDTTFDRFIAGLRFTNGANGSGPYLDNVGNISVVRCGFVSSTGENVWIKVSGASTHTSISQCSFETSSAAVAGTGGIQIASTAGNVWITESTFKYNNANKTQSVVSTSAGATSNVYIGACFFDVSILGTVAITTSVLSFAHTGMATTTILGNVWTDAAGTTGAVNCIVYSGGSSSARVYENGSTFGTIGGASPPNPYGTVWTRGLLGSRESRFATVSDSGSATLSLSVTGLYTGIITIVQNTSGANQTLNLPNTMPLGAKLTITYHNDTAGVTGTITWGAGIRSSATTFTVNANSASSFYFQRVTLNSSSVWVIMGTSAANFAE